MASERTYIPASQFCASVRDGTHDSPKPVENGRKLVTSRHLTTGRLDLTDAYLISEADFESINKRSKVDRWDVLISMIGTVGEACLIKGDPDFAIKNIGLFKTKSESDGKWLYYYLRSSEAQQQIKAQSRGTTQQYIPLGALRDFPILVTENPEEQKAIAGMLGALDDKIELNRRMNATLEAMARALFQSWFVDFDPVRAKLDRRQPTVLDKSTAALFPDSFQDSELGHIPKDWQVATIDVVASVSSGKRPIGRDDTLSDECNVPLYGGGGRMGYVPSPLYKKPILFTGRVGTLGLIFRTADPSWPSDNTLVVEPQDGFFDFTYFVLKGFDLITLNRGSTQPLLTQTDLKSQRFVLPSCEIVKAFAKFAAPIFEQITRNENQSRTLATLRDTLLPKLLSGELSVPGAAKEMESLA